MTSKVADQIWQISHMGGGGLWITIGFSTLPAQSSPQILGTHCGPGASRPHPFAQGYHEVQAHSHGVSLPFRYHRIEVIHRQRSFKVLPRVRDGSSRPIRGFTAFGGHTEDEELGEWRRSCK